jgi:hypothetical protein
MNDGFSFNILILRQSSTIVDTKADLERAKRGYG